jgi:hypothetical protein
VMPEAITFLSLLLNPLFCFSVFLMIAAIGLGAHAFSSNLAPRPPLRARRGGADATLRSSEATSLRSTRGGGEETLRCEPEIWGDSRGLGRLVLTSALC